MFIGTRDIFDVVEEGDLAALKQSIGTDVAQIALKNNLSDTLLHHAGSEAIAEFLIANGADINAQGWMGRTPLHEAAANGRVDVARTLLHHGADVNARRERGDTPLHWAATATMVSLLINHGAEREAKDQFGRTPLHWAAQTGRTEVVERLIAMGADINARCADEETPLHGAAKVGTLAVARMLIQAGALIDAQDDFGDTPLHEAVLSERDEIARFLLSMRADVSIRNNAGQTPLHKAMEANQAAMVAMLRTHARVSHAVAPAQQRKLISQRICTHPRRQEAITVARHAILARWTLNDEPRLLNCTQTEYSRLPQIVTTPDGEQLAMITPESLIEFRRWDDLMLEERILAPPGEHIGAMGFSPDGRWLAMACSGEKILLVDRVTRKVTTIVAGGERNYALCFDPTSQLIASACSYQGGGHIRIDRVTPDGLLKPYRELSRSTIDTPGNEFVDTLVALTFSLDGRWLIVFETSAVHHDARPPGWRGDLVVYSLARGQIHWKASIDASVTDDARPLQETGYPMGFFTEILCLHTAEVVCGSTQGTLLFYRLADGKLTRRVTLDPETAIQALALDSHGTTLWVVLNNGVLTPVPI